MVLIIFKILTVRLQEVAVDDFFFPFVLSLPPKELVAEKERNGLLTAKMRERINTLEKEHGTFQSKIHVSYQESQQMKMKVSSLPKLLD